MEQTIGERIMENRKRLGMTQDQLAVQLGVTAQAVSKWEHNLSCPDISTIPKLAEIFGISTDVLLGVSGQAETVSIPSPGVPEDPGREKNHWQFKWDNSRRGNLFLAIIALFTGATYLICQLFLPDRDISFWNILWPVALTVFGFGGIWPKFSCFRLCCGVLGGYFLASNIAGIHLSIQTGILVALGLLLFGGSLLVDVLKKPQKPTISSNYNTEENKKADYQQTEDAFYFSGSFDDREVNVSLPHLREGTIVTSFGDYTVDLTCLQSVSSNCTLKVSCSFGNTYVRIPRKFSVECSEASSFADIHYSGTPDPSPAGIIRINASVSFGNLQIQYV